MHGNHAEPWALAVIVACYVIFAVQLRYQAGSKLLKTPGGRAISVLVAVFVLCAMTGYAIDLFPVVPLLEIWSHRVLAIAAIALVVSNSAGAAAAMIRHERDRMK